MTIIKELVIAKRTYKDIMLFDTPQEALAAGYHILYHDEQSRVSIYGKRIDSEYPKLVIPAAVLDSVKENG